MSPPQTHVVPLRAMTLTPFAYHSFTVQKGTATIPECISDTALAFGLAATLGMMANRVALPKRDYRTHLAAMPYRASLLVTDQPRLLPPLLRQIQREDVANGTHADHGPEIFSIQEIPAEQLFLGAVFGFDPFAYTGLSELVIRVGLHRSGMVLLQRADPPMGHVYLNSATAHLFGRTLPVERYGLHTLQRSAAMSLEEAAMEVAHWQ